ncbi:MAG: 50S ribosomal protein L18 [Desulfatirhabdiaceae bacterium]
MRSTNTKLCARIKRKKRIRKTLVGTPERPRLCVYRSSNEIYAQIIDDSTGRTLVSASSIEPEIRTQKNSRNKVQVAVFIGKRIAEKAIQAGIKKVVFDRNGFLYHGRIKALSDGAREIGLDF